MEYRDSDGIGEYNLNNENKSFLIKSDIPRKIIVYADEIVLAMGGIKISFPLKCSLDDIEELIIKFVNQTYTFKKVKK